MENEEKSAENVLFSKLMQKERIYPNLFEELIEEQKRGSVCLRWLWEFVGDAVNTLAGKLVSEIQQKAQLPQENLGEVQLTLFFRAYECGCPECKNFVKAVMQAVIEYIRNALEYKVELTGALEEVTNKVLACPKVTGQSQNPKEMLRKSVECACKECTKFLKSFILQYDRWLHINNRCC